MMDRKWDRPGIVPGLDETNHVQRSRPSRVSANIFSFVSDPLDEKSPPGLGALKLGGDYRKSQTSCNLDEEVEIPKSSFRVLKDSLLIRGCQLGNKDENSVVDILITKGKIRAIAEGLDFDTDNPDIDAKNLFVQPGFVDSISHSNAIQYNENPSNLNIISPAKLEEYTKKAALNGFTTIVDTLFISENRSPLVEVAAYLQVSQVAKLSCNLLLRVCFSEISSSTSSTIEELVRQYAISLFMFSISDGDKDAYVELPGRSLLFRALKTCRSLGLIPVICINERLLPSPKFHRNCEISNDSLDEQKLASAAIAVAKAAACPIIISPIREQDTMVKINNANREIEQYLIVADWSTNTFNNQPQSTRETVQDLAPFLAADENVILSSGQIYNGLSISLHDDGAEPTWNNSAWKKFVEQGWASDDHIKAATSSRPSKLLGLYPRKGSLHVGADADLVLWSSTDIIRPVFTIISGKVITQNGTLKTNSFTDVNSARIGEYIEAKRSSYFLQVAVKEKLAQISLRVNNEEKDDKIKSNCPIVIGPMGDKTIESQQTSDKLNVLTPVGRSIYSSGFKLSGEQDGDDRPIRPSVRIWNNMSKNPRPF